MTREKLILKRMTLEVTHLWVYDKPIFKNRNSKTKELNKQKKKKKKKTQILNKIMQFSRQQQIQKIKQFKYYTEKDK